MNRPPATRAGPMLTAPGDPADEPRHLMASGYLTPRPSRRTTLTNCTLDGEQNFEAIGPPGVGACFAFSYFDENGLADCD